jgi:hypothetical protein
MDHIDILLSKLGYSELVQRLLEKMTFSLVDPQLHAKRELEGCSGSKRKLKG